MRMTTGDKRACKVFVTALTRGNSAAQIIGFLMQPPRVGCCMLLYRDEVGRAERGVLLATSPVQRVFESVGVGVRVFHIETQRSRYRVEVIEDYVPASVREARDAAERGEQLENAGTGAAVKVQQPSPPNKGLFTKQD